ncbi:MAG: sigma-70 family RNA polymerase sigma factor [Oscillospiraceae bacterium]|nr:sigma-70 family RNA polymerase sigma factor [Oscillospiraceae bacterium]MBQ5324737.1 sigma-70 family RNA polymerase sigma factor [Oscillospiraceae bacterium]
MDKFIKSLFASLMLKSKIIWYINGPQTLPPPLTQEEEQIVFEGLERGEKQAREKMIVHNLRLVIYIAKKFECSAVSVDDLTSIGSLGLIKAVNSFIPSKNIKFATYASRCVENEILMYLRKQSNRNVDVSIDDALSVDSDGNELNLIDVLYTDEYEVSKNIEQESEKQVLWQSINSLTGREREIILMRFGLNGNSEKTQKEVADEIGISQSYISRLEKRIFKKLRKEIERTV